MSTDREYDAQAEMVDDYDGDEIETDNFIRANCHRHMELARIFVIVNFERTMTCIGSFFPLPKKSENGFYLKSPGFSETDNSCSLSQRERVRVRENASPIHVVAGIPARICAIFHASPA